MIGESYLHHYLVYSLKYLSSHFAKKQGVSIESLHLTNKSKTMFLRVR
jgi:hypothetical protein